MATSALSRQRLFNQHVVQPRFRTAAELVRWMGAVQAQDFLGSLWAVGLRLPGAREPDVEGAIAARTIVRTWPMRGTLHYVPAADTRWMLRLLTPRVIARSAGRYRELELDDTAFERSGRILTRALRGGRQLTRADAYAELARGGVSPAGQRGIHILGHLAQHGLICFGPRKGRQPTFVLLDEWLPPGPDTPREDALATLAQRYFASHGPATVQDFAWWSGLVVKDAQEAIEAAGSRLTAETREGRRWWSSSGVAVARRAKRPTAALLPPWDEYIVAYKDRAFALDHLVGREDLMMTVGKPLVVVDGRVRGSWARILTTSTVRIGLDFWNAVTRGERRAVERAAIRYGRFLGKEVLGLP